MNFLGHCFFSESTPDAFAGSLWPDFGRRPEADVLSAEFWTHFDRHQRIDKITDNHEILESLRIELRPIFRKTSPIVVDMMLDHHLAKHWFDYHDQPLASYSVDVYRQLALFSSTPLPDRFQRTLHYMAQYNWFVSYASETGLVQALEGMSRRIHFNNPLVEHASKVIGFSQQFERELDQFMVYLLSQFPNYRRNS